MNDTQESTSPDIGGRDNVIAFPTTAVVRIVVREAGYLAYPDWTEDELPSYREAWGYDDAGYDSQIQMLINISCLSEDELASAYDLEPGPDGWSYDHHHELEALFLDDLARRISPEELGPALQRTHAPQSGGFAVLDALPADECKRLGLREIEGPQPGSDYCGVYYDGDLQPLNETLRRQGANIVVRHA
jgi:hypothetical protein